MSVAECLLCCDGECALGMQVYQGRLTVDGLVQQMVVCRQGGEGSREHQIFEAVLNVIYEEFQFLHNFPDKELQMTAQVLASLVRTYLEMLRLESQDQSTPI